MPAGIYKRTKEHRRKISNGLRRAWGKPEIRKKLLDGLKRGREKSDFSIGEWSREHRGWNKGIKTGLVPGTAFKKGNVPWNKGNMGICSEEYKKKMSESRLERKRRLGYLNSKETREKMSKAHTGKTLSKKTRRKLSNINQGENSSNWKGGITPRNKRIRSSIETRLWRESVFARDDWTCRKCGEWGGELRPHHLLNFAEYPKLRFAIDNGITFCQKCHKRFHKIYGMGGNTKEQVGEFLKACRQKRRTKLSVAFDTQFGG